MEKVIDDIQSGKFSEDLEIEESGGYKIVNEFFEKKKSAYITVAEDRVKELLEEYL
jgi:ketol-acid reductoisomerase